MQTFLEKTACAAGCTDVQSQASWKGLCYPGGKKKPSLCHLMACFTGEDAEVQSDSWQKPLEALNGFAKQKSK